jgi:hypothetical protein
VLQCFSENFQCRFAKPALGDKIEAPDPLIFKAKTKQLRRGRWMKERLSEIYRSVFLPVASPSESEHNLSEIATPVPALIAFDRLCPGLKALNSWP